jgi:alkylation response protein AidB-like acyl-CoA dehydrogenase
MSESPIPSAPRVDYWQEDPVLRALVGAALPAAARDAAEPALAQLGRAAGLEVPPLAAEADRFPPRLVTHDPEGRRIDRVDYHPSYRRMEELAYGSGMIALKYAEGPMRPHRHVVGYAMGYLFAQAEAGLYCPVCMTDGVARVLERYGSDAQRRQWIPRLASRDRASLARGAMFLTERHGGSDVGEATRTVARRVGDGWRLRGDKWFCSNVDAEVALALARPEGAPAGTAGLGLFLLPRDLEGGSRNGYRIERLKDKLGTRSMPTGEITLEDASVELVGDASQGFHMMAEMLNLSRLYNAVASVAGLRRGCVEARHFLTERRAFGRAAIGHPLARRALEQVEASQLAGLLLTWRTIRLLDDADAGDRDAALLVRMLTPLVKYTTAKAAVAGVSECLELHGGQGYVEESVMPRLLRDCQVLPIWEGTTNILVLDTLRALRRTEGGVDRILALAAGPSGSDVAPPRRDRLAAALRHALASPPPEDGLREATDLLAAALEEGELARARGLPALAEPASRALALRGA